MSGIVVFRSIQAAKEAGFEIYDVSRYAIIARKRLPSGWAFAFVESKNEPGGDHANGK